MSQRHKSDQSRLQKLIDMDIPYRLEPEQRLMLAVLRQAVLDYFGDNPDEKKTAADYFAGSPIYRLTLQMFHLPGDMLPIGIDVGGSAAAEPVDPLRLETLVNNLSGSQLKVMLTMGLLELPVAAGRISQQCRLNRGTVLKALTSLAEEGLVMAVDTGLYTIWTVPPEAQQFLDELWSAAGREPTPLPEPDEPPGAEVEPPEDSATESAS